MMHINFLQAGAGIEIVHRESICIPLAVEPDVPQKERINNLRIAFQESRKVYQHTVVQRSLYTNFMQAFSIAMEILDSIGIRLEYVGTTVYLM